MSGARASGQKAEGRVNVETAAQLLDFRGNGISPISEHAAAEQLRGAVALHNVLQEERFAYLADEVGMGKTYVALGALALFRHFDPSFRVLVIAPRENIQKKWVKELRNFTARNIRFSDLRTRAVHGAPARATVLCNSLVELVREAAVDPDRDFFARLTSFSLPLGERNPDAWRTKRDQLREHLPWLEPSLFDLRNKERFKDNFARAVNCGLPTFDLVILDEGHNLKAGFHADAASRNRMLALALGHPTQRDAAREGFPGYAPRAKRVLFLSATPLENDYVQLWNQLDVFGFGARAPVLRDQHGSDDEKREFARRFLIRRVTTLPVGGQEMTKNLYRREWRNGGVSTHDEPLVVPDERQRLTVALVQKKVSEVLRGSRFNNSFQIGMLASFESFLETAGVRSADTEQEGVSTFDGADQTDRADERLGVDVGAINGLARNYRRQFGSELPHPKMDAVVDRLAEAFTTAEKSLVFVRRVASVKELQRKLEERYDEYVFRRLRTEIKPSLLSSIERFIAQYRDDRSHERRRRDVDSAILEEAAAPDEETIVEEPTADDQGGLESFFAWFFRGEGPDSRMLSGATLQKRFSQAGSIHSTFFEDNHVAWLLGTPPGQVTAALASYLGRPVEPLARELEHSTAALLPAVKKQHRRNVFLAFQQAAVTLLAEHPGALQERARIVREERYATGDLSTKGTPEPPALDDWLELSTFWTALRERPRLRDTLWPVPHGSDARAHFRETEIRRELLSAMARLGHPFVDLYVLSVNRLDRLDLRVREQDDGTGNDLASDFLDLLERQSARPGENTSFHELHEAAQNFDLILAVNEPSVRSESLDGAATRFGRLLRAQQPVGGMFGQVNETLVRQFRMPGYPLVLITTDLLQEGEDLHTFCSAVYHYGISWMPSSTEQRVGRVDRVSSQTDRRLTSSPSLPDGHKLLQVYYPHLRDTVEVLQVGRVLERLNRFMRLMHENLGGHESEERRLNVTTEILRVQRQVEPIREPLRTAFPVRDEMLRAPARALAVTPGDSVRLFRRFLALQQEALGNAGIEWEDRIADNALFGTMQLRTRRQPFTLLLRSVQGRAVVRCVSPVGHLSLELTEEAIRSATRSSGVRVGAVFNQSLASYNLTIEGDVLLGAPRADAGRVTWLLQRVAGVADRLEEMLLGLDAPMSKFRSDLETEAVYER
jgi:hypothetical protein